jgi:hypothetical protein
MRKRQEHFLCLPAASGPQLPPHVEASKPLQTAVYTSLLSLEKHTGLTLTLCK